MPTMTKSNPQTTRGRKPAEWKRYAAGSEVDHFRRFCSEYLVQSIDEWDGQPLNLEPFQRRLMGEALAYDSNGWPIWGSVVILMPRKNGKTQLLAAYAVYRLLTSDGTPEILLAASSDKQAGRLFEACAMFVRRDPRLAALCRVRDFAGEIVREDGQGKILRLSSSPERLHGYNPSLVICDELAQWLTPTLRRAYAALTSGGGARQAPQTFTITTAGEARTRHDSILGRILDAGLACNDITAQPGLSICRMWDARTLVVNYEAPTTNPHDTKALKLANPASWITREYLKRQAENPELTASDVLQLHGCVWAAASTTWVAPADWDACRVDRVLEEGEEIVLGFDGSDRRDETALVASTLDGFVTPLQVWRRPVNAAEAWRIPRAEVSAAVDAAFTRYDVLELAADPPGWYAEIDEWRDRYGEEIVLDFETKQPKRMAPACERFETAARERTLSHGGDETLSAHIGHCVAKETLWGRVVTKDHPDSPRKIDAAIAGIIAFDRAMWHAAQNDSEDLGFMIVDPASA